MKECKDLEGAGDDAAVAFVILVTQCRYYVIIKLVSVSTFLTYLSMFQQRVLLLPVASVHTNCRPYIISYLIVSFYFVRKQKNLRYPSGTHCMNVESCDVAEAAQSTVKTDGPHSSVLYNSDERTSRFLMTLRFLRFVFSATNSSSPALSSSPFTSSSSSGLN